MSNSPLVGYTRLSPNRNHPRNHPIDTITIHHMAGNLTVETCGAVFAKSSRQASSNYGIGSDGRIALYVDEADRSWASSSRENDHRAVTIEVANCAAADPWPVSGAAYRSLVELVADICRRNGKRRITWLGSAAATNAHKFAPDEMRMTVHRWFAATACPGPTLLGKMEQIAAEVNQKLASGGEGEEKSKTGNGKDSPASWAAAAWDKARNTGTMDGTRPDQAITRQEVAVILDRLGLLEGSR